ncbi:hypothetical protein A3Q56_02323 [Intoshia linei]|uniref:Uncharacterized protein n=1 Tax=Intoshia linei TaxID=1819745 RepID=A0A177B8Q4_9BILA|nr:hypothetical protein A3Q56_02323 [Intoshia linei]
MEETNIQSNLTRGRNVSFQVIEAIKNQNFDSSSTLSANNLKTWKIIQSLCDPQNVYLWVWFFENIFD